MTRTTVLPRPVLRTQAVRKAKSDKPLPVAAYDAKGVLVGIVMDPDDIMRVADTSPAVDLQPVPPAEVGTPADGVAKSAAAIRDFKKGLYGGRTTAEQNEIAALMNAAAISRLDQIHQRPRTGR